MHGMPLLVGHAYEEAVAVDAGVVDEHVHGSERGFDLGRTHDRLRRDR